MHKQTHTHTNLWSNKFETESQAETQLLINIYIETQKSMGTADTWATNPELSLINILKTIFAKSTPTYLANTNQDWLGVSYNHILHYTEWHRVAQTAKPAVPTTTCNQGSVTRETWMQQMTNLVAVATVCQTDSLQRWAMQQHKVQPEKK